MSQTEDDRIEEIVLQSTPTPWRVCQHDIVSSLTKTRVFSLVPYYDTTPLLVTICRRRARSRTIRSTCLPNLKTSSSPTTKIQKAIQNVENKVVWDS